VTCCRCSHPGLGVRQPQLTLHGFAGEVELVAEADTLVEHGACPAGDRQVIEAGADAVARTRPENELEPADRLVVGEAQGALKPIEPSDAGIMMAFAQKVIVVPRYGMAVAQAQHKVWELCQLLIDKGVMVQFAIHPIAGRMPGHMNVLLAEAGVPYDLISDLEEINAEFETTDVALVIGANDVVNPVVRTDKSSPIYGMPILNADKAKNALVIKRGRGAGFSGIENHLLYLDNTRMVYGDAQKVAVALLQAVKASG
jgi:NAD(P) transhydrogenase subunit beta